MADVTDDEIKAIAQKAATEAVEETLRRLNLNDDNSGQDVHDLRELLSSFRRLRYWPSALGDNLLKKVSG